jgi:Adenylate sensor of SNF1-like protein kinase
MTAAQPQSATPDSPAVDSPAAGQDTATGKPKSNRKSKISLLTSSYPLVHARMYSNPSAPQGGVAGASSRTVRGINLEGEMKVFVPPVIKRKPQRYHFGIRSRGQGALEVMQEIYKSLERMSAEWIEKPPNPDNEGGTLPLDPFTIKCRWRKQYPRRVWRGGKMVGEGVDDMFVYMEIQLYQQPEPKDYLVDFKWGGYELVGGEKEKEKRASVVAGGEDSVHSCFPFLDLASTLINALARGGD